MIWVGIGNMAKMRSQGLLNRPDWRRCAA